MCIHANMTNTADKPKYTPPSREGKTLIGAHFDQNVRRELKAIAALEDTSIQALLEEAVTRLIDERKARHAPD